MHINVAWHGTFPIIVANWAIGARPFTFQPGADRRHVAAGCASLISSWPCAAVRPCAFPLMQPSSPAWQYSAGRQRSRALRSTPSAPRIYPSWMKSELMSGAKPHVSFSSFGPPTRSLMNPCFWSRCAIARPPSVSQRRPTIAVIGSKLEAIGAPAAGTPPTAIVVSPLGTACRSRPLAACCERLALDGSGSKLGHDGRFLVPHATD